MVSIIACKGPRPTKGRVPQAAFEEVVRIQFPQKRYRMAIRMYKEIFSVIVWLTETIKGTSTVWALVMTSRTDDGRMREVKGVWDRTREVFERLSLRDLAYEKVPRGRTEMAADLPVRTAKQWTRSRLTSEQDPPYHFRQRTIAKRQEAVEAHIMTIGISGK